MGIQVIRTGTNWTVDVTALGLVNDTAEKDFLVVVNKVEQSLAAYAKTTATVITYSGAALPANTVIDIYRWGLRDVDPLEYGEVTSQLGMNKRLTQIERVLDDLREVKQFIWDVVDGTVAVNSHVAQADPHTQYRLKSAAIPVAELSGTLSDVQIPALIARDTEVAAAIAAHEAGADPHPVYTTAAELTAALTGYLPTTQKGAVNGIAPLDGSSKIPAINSRGCSAVYTASTGVWLFTWADGSTQSIDTPLELVFQSVNYNTTTKQVTFTLVGGATTSFSLADLVDLPEIQIATSVPSVTPTTGQRLYFRSDTGEYWVSTGVAWAGPFLNLSSAERTKLAGIAAGATANSTDAQLRDRSTHTGTQSSATITGLGALAAKSAIVDADVAPGAAIGWAKIASGETAIGGALRTVVDAAAARGAIEAQSALYPGASRVSTLPASGTVGQLVQLPDNSVWQWRTNFVEASTTWMLVEMWGLSTQARIDATPFLIYNSSAAVPAVADRNGVLRGVNWPECVADPVVVNGGNYSWRVTGNYKLVTSDRTIILKPGIKYGVIGSIKGQSTSDFYYVFLQPLDSDGLTVFVYNQFINSGTSTTLAAPLSVGQTTMTIVTPATAWVAGSGQYRYASVYPYTNSKGRIYPTPTNYVANGEPGYYTRYQKWTQTYTNNGNGTATVGLLSAWSDPNPAAGSGGVWPIGTEVANSHDNGGTYYYPYNRNNTLVWDVLSPSNTAGFFCSVGTPGQVGVPRLRYGAESTRFGVLTGYGAGGWSTWLSGLDIKPFD